MKQRIIGIDVARAVAVIGMIVVNFKVVFGEKGDSWLKIIAYLFEGKAAATFVVLAGIALVLNNNKSIQEKKQAKLKSAQKGIIKRAIFLFFVGLSYIWIWPADILHFYGVYMLITLPFLKQNSRKIIFGIIALTFLFPILLLFIDYEKGWNFTNLEYIDFWTFEGFFRNLFFNGFHPVIPWTAFMLAGLWLGKQNLYDVKFLKKLLIRSSVIFFSIQIISNFFVHFIAENKLEKILAQFFVGTSPMPPMPFYMFNGITFAFMLISLSIIISKKFEKNFLIDAFYKTGKLALTFYVAHVIVGMGVIEIIFPNSFGTFSINFSIIYAVTFSFLCVVFAVIWLSYKKIGPIEWLMRKATN